MRASYIRSRSSGLPASQRKIMVRGKVLTMMSITMGILALAYPIYQSANTIAALVGERKEQRGISSRDAISPWSLTANAFYAVLDLGFLWALAIAELVGCIFGIIAARNITAAQAKVFSMVMLVTGILSTGHSLWLAINYVVPELRLGVSAYGGDPLHFAIFYFIVFSVASMALHLAATLIGQWYSTAIENFSRLSYLDLEEELNPEHEFQEIMAADGAGAGAGARATSNSYQAQAFRPLSAVTFVDDTTTKQEQQPPKKSQADIDYSAF